MKNTVKQSKETAPDTQALVAYLLEAAQLSQPQPGEMRRDELKQQVCGKTGISENCFRELLARGKRSGAITWRRIGREYYYRLAVKK